MSTLLNANFLLLVIEHLPTELRDRFTEMREIDLGVENSVDTLDTRYQQFFVGAGGAGLLMRLDSNSFLIFRWTTLFRLVILGQA